MRATTMIGFVVGVVVGVVGTNLYREGQLPLSEIFKVSAPELVGDCKMIGATAGVRIPVYSLECFPKGEILGAPPPANRIGEPAGG